MDRGRKKSRRSVTGTGPTGRVSHAQWWEEDLDDINDILRREIPDTTHRVSQTSLNNDLLTFPTLPVQIASRPRIPVQSDFPSFPVAHQLKLDEIDLGKLTGDTPTDNTNQPSNITGVQTSQCVMGGAVSGPETTSPERSSHFKCFPKENRGKLLFEYSEREKNGNGSHTRKPTNSTQAPNCGKLFGILSLILQALNSPLTEVLEECYAGALQIALMEIQSAVAIYNSLIDQKSVVNY